MPPRRPREEKPRVARATSAGEASYNQFRPKYIKKITCRLGCRRPDSIIPSGESRRGRQIILRASGNEVGNKKGGIHEVDGFLPRQEAAVPAGSDAGGHGAHCRICLSGSGGGLVVVSNGDRVFCPQKENGQQNFMKSKWIRSMQHAETMVAAYHTGKCTCV